MCADDVSKPREAAITQLEAFGLSTYAARTFVALISLGEGTAQDVSDVANVPRTRVYDAATELREYGLVDVQNTSPRRFLPISAETTGRKFHQDFARRVRLLSEAMEAIEPVDNPSEQRGVWTVTGRDTVSERVLSFIEAATDEIVYMAVAGLLSDECLDALARAADRGVTIRLAGSSPGVRADIEERVPEAELFDSIWVGSDMPAGRLLLVDREKTLSSVLVPGDGIHLPDARDETAIWGAGETNSLVVVLKALFTWQLDDAGL